LIELLGSIEKSGHVTRKVSKCPRFGTDWDGFLQLSKAYQLYRPTPALFPTRQGFRAVRPRPTRVSSTSYYFTIPALTSQLEAPTEIQQSIDFPSDRTTVSMWIEEARKVVGNLWSEYKATAPAATNASTLVDEDDEWSADDQTSIAD
jgi:hypothetical protein